VLFVPLHSETLIAVSLGHTQTNNQENTRHTIQVNPCFNSCLLASRHSSFIASSRLIWDWLALKIDSCQIDNFVAASAENRFHHEKAETFRLFQSDRGWHRKLLTRHQNLDQRRAVILESLRNHGFYFVYTRFVILQNRPQLSAPAIAK